LKSLLEEARNSSGVGRLVIGLQIRTYCQQQSVPSLLKEIESVWDEKDLNILIGAGMSGVLYYKCLGQKERMAGV
jgi:hypothetical protein